MDDSVPPLIPRPGDGKRGRDGHIGYLLRQAHAAFRGAQEHALADLDLTPPQFVILTMLNAYPGVSGADLARLALLTPQTVGAIIANLIRADLIARQVHPVHGRILRLALTAAGKARLGRARARVDRLERRVLAGLAAQDEAAIRNWLVTLAETLG
jgi:DNA-binding MarR family transcriptional regulator